MTKLLNGRLAAATVIDEVKRASDELQARVGVRVGLAVVIVGDDPASHAYVNAKAKMAKECGFNSVVIKLPADASQTEVSEVISSLNHDKAIHGVLVQLPLPKHLDSHSTVQSILPEKDVDGLTALNAGKLATGDLDSGIIPCTPAGVAKLLLDCHGADLSRLNAVVIGTSNLFGKPMPQLLLNANAAVILARKAKVEASFRRCGRKDARRTGPSDAMGVSAYGNVS